MVASYSSETLPQVVSITPLKDDGALTLKKTVRTYLHLGPGERVGLRIGDEVWLTAPQDDAQGQVLLDVARRGRVQLPAEVLNALGVVGAGNVALVQRPDAVAVKRCRLELTRGPSARFTDAETPTAIKRCVQMNPLPGDALPDLVAQAKSLRLKAGIRAFLRDRQTYHAWCARRKMGLADAGDTGLCRRLVEERLSTQQDNGAWGGDKGNPIRTARVLRELADLGLDSDHPDVQRAIAWLLLRPESRFNPGQWLGNDDLVATQAEVMAARASQTRGTKPRFRQIRASEQREVRGADDLIANPCGPRIMWPNALVLEALLRLGCEDAPRVQAALAFMRTQDWCECGYQNGTFDCPERIPFSGDRLVAFEEACVSQYLYAGLYHPEELLERDLAHQPVRFQRVAAEPGPADAASTTVYTLQIDRHIQGCEFITTRALAPVKDPEMRRFAEAHLWRFAGNQLADGTFPPERHGTGFTQIGILEVFSRYPHHPVAQTVILKSLPWLVEAQRQDGAWALPTDGSRRVDPRVDATTRAAVNVLGAVRDHLPEGFGYA